MKTVLLSTTPRANSGHEFQIHQLGLHERMKVEIVNRPLGTGDYLFMLFHSQVWVRDVEGESSWPANSLMIWTPKDGHYYGDAAKEWGHSWFHCAGDSIQRLLQKNGIPLRTRIALNDSSQMERFLLNIIEELTGWGTPDEVIIRNLFENFARGLARQISTRAQPLAPAALLAIRSHLEQHAHERPSLPELARRAGWSVPHLCAEFKRFFGIPVIQYLQQVRMNQAVYLLRDQNRRVGEIALTLGYPDLYAFSKMFKKQRGVSPKKFRESQLR